MATSIICGLGITRETVGMHLVHDDKVLGWIEMNAEEADNFIKAFTAYRNMLKDKLPEPVPAGGFMQPTRAFDNLLAKQSKQQ